MLMLRTTFILQGRNVAPVRMVVKTFVLIHADPFNLICCALTDISFLLISVRYTYFHSPVGGSVRCL